MRIHWNLPISASRPLAVGGLGLLKDVTKTRNGEPGTGNREPGTGNREPGTGNREQGTGNREQGSGNERSAVFHIKIQNGG